MYLDSHFLCCSSGVSSSPFQKTILEIQFFSSKFFQCTDHEFLNTYPYNVGDGNDSKVLSPFLHSCLVAVKLPQAVTYVKWFICPTGSSKENYTQFNASSDLVAVYERYEYNIFNLIFVISSTVNFM